MNEKSVEVLKATISNLIFEVARLEGDKHDLLIKNKELEDELESVQGRSK